MSRSLILTAVAGFAITLAGCAETASPFTGKMVNASELALELQAETRKVEADTRQQAAKAKADAAALESAAKRKSREFALSVRTVKADADAKVEQLGIEADQSAEAIARGEADINQCPPGGTAGIVKLATLLNRPARPLNPANGIDAVQLELAQCNYMDEDSFAYDKARALRLRKVIRQLLEEVVPAQRILCGTFMFD